MSNATTTVVSGTTVAVAVLANVTSVIVLFGIACSVELSQLRAARRQYSAASIGLLSQWLFMPAMTCAFALAFDLDDHLAFTLITLGCAPGGTSSNTIAYFAGGDQPLSLLLTSITNFLALGSLPLLLYVWTSWASVDMMIPFDQIIISLVVVLIPATSGVYFRIKRPRAARFCEKTGAGFGAFVTLLVVVIGVVGNREALATEGLLPTKAWAAVALAAPCGMLWAFLALGVATCVRMACAKVRGSSSGKGGASGITGVAAASGTGDGAAAAAAAGDGGGDAADPSSCAMGFGVPQAVTVILETGIQNVPLALAVINGTLARGTYTPTQVLGSQLLAAIWSFITTVEGICVLFVSRRYQRRRICPPYTDADAPTTSGVALREASAGV